MIRLASLIATAVFLVAGTAMSQTSLTESEIAAGSVVRVVAFSDDSRTLVAGTMDGLKFWDTDRREFTQRDVRKFNGLDEVPVRFTLLLVEDSLGEFLAEDSDGSIVQPRVAGNSRDGRVVAYADMSAREMRLVEYESGQRIFTFPGGLGQPTGVEFSPDGSLIAATYQDTNIYVWNVAEGRLVKVTLTSFRC